MFDIDQIHNNKQLQEFVRFCVVGLLCTVIDAAIYYIVRLFAPYIVALVSGYLLSLAVNYLLTTLWTFKKKPNKRNAIGIILAHLFNLFVVRMSLMWLFVSVCGTSDSIAYVPTLLISVITNFFIVRFVVKKTDE